MIVVDNSLLIDGLVDTGERGRKAMDRIKGEEMAAPELLDIEAMSTLRGLVLANKLSAARAGLALRGLAALPIERFGHEALVPRIWQLRNNVTPYDASYVALAEDLDVTLVTGDARLAAAPGIRCSVEVLR